MLRICLIFLVFSTACARTEFPPPPVPREYKMAPQRDYLKPPSIPDLAYGRQKPPTYEEVRSQFSERGRGWFYGAGLGKTIGNIGAAVAFPPYLAYLVGNAGLSLAGYEPLYVTDLLPEEEGQGVQQVYDAVTSVPGLVAARVAGEKFNTPESLR